MSYDKKYVEFYNGQKMPIIGLGTWQSTPEEIKTAVKTAIDTGYRHIDTAFAYMNEKAIGDALKEIFAQGKVRREDLFIVTKLPPNSLNAEHVKRLLTKSLAALQLDYVDLYLVHSPIGFKHITDEEVFPRDADKKLLLDCSTDIIKVWKKMEEMVDLGLAKSIGVSNFSIDQVGRILKSCRIKPANNQVECHAYLQQKKLFNFCKENGVTLCAYAPIGSPGLGSFLEKFTGKEVKFPILLEDPVLKPMSEKYKKNPSQILLRWLIQRGMVVIPKSTNPQRIKENFNIFDFKLTAEECKLIDGLDRNFRMFQVDEQKQHPEYQLDDTE